MSPAETQILDSPPSLLGLLARAGGGALPLASRLPWIGGAGGDELPQTVLGLDGVSADRERLTAYDRVCGFRLSDVLPPTYPHILAFPLQLSLMTARDFPFPAIGLVHIENRITQHRPIFTSEALSLRVRAGDLRDHPRGLQFSLFTEARVGDELVWEEESTNLRRGAGSGGSREGADEATPQPATSAVWKLPGDLGRRYGAVAGDLNPIHLHPLSARLFGFPRAIAHGMWTKARCLAWLEPRLPDAFSVEVSFRKPILLPGRVEFAAAEDDGVPASFEVRATGARATHLTGKLRAS